MSGGKLHWVPSGLISVMPQAWQTLTPCCSKPSISEREAAEPPTTMSANPSGKRPRCLISFIKPIQTVGTPQAEKTFSRSIRSNRLLPSSAPPGKIRTRAGQRGGIGQPPGIDMKQWHHGQDAGSFLNSTFGIVTHMLKACSTVERCEYSVPLGLPVVPDV